MRTTRDSTDSFPGATRYTAHFTILYAAVLSCCHSLPFLIIISQKCKQDAHQLFPPSPSSCPIPLFRAAARLEVCCRPLPHIHRVAVGPQHAPRHSSSRQLATGRAQTAGTVQIRMGRTIKTGSGRQNKPCYCQECAPLALSVF